MRLRHHNQRALPHGDAGRGAGELVADADRGVASHGVVGERVFEALEGHAVGGAVGGEHGDDPRCLR